MKKSLVDIGLCQTCLHHSLVKNARDSEFHLCEKSKIDSSFPKYPRLPVHECKGFLSKSDNGDTNKNSG